MDNLILGDFMNNKNIYRKIYNLGKKYYKKLNKHNNEKSCF